MLPLQHSPFSALLSASLNPKAASVDLFMGRLLHVTLPQLSPPLQGHFDCSALKRLQPLGGSALGLPLCARECVCVCVMSLSQGLEGGG